MSKRERLLREQLQEAVNRVRDEASAQHDFDRGVQSGASMVMVRLCEIERRDAEMKKEGIQRGSP